MYARANQRCEQRADASVLSGPHFADGRWAPPGESGAAAVALVAVRFAVDDRNRRQSRSVQFLTRRVRKNARYIPCMPIAVTKEKKRDRKIKKSIHGDEKSTDLCDFPRD